MSEEPGKSALACAKSAADLDLSRLPEAIR